MLSSPWASAHLYHTHFLSSPTARASNGYFQALYRAREQTEYSNICIALGFLISYKQKSLQRLEQHIPKESRWIDRCSGFLSVQTSEPRGCTPAPHTLFGFSQGEFLPPASQSEQQQSGDALLSEEKGQYIFSSFDHRMTFRKASSNTHMLPATSWCRLAPPLSASISSGLAKLGVLPPFQPRVSERGRWGCWGVDRHWIC